MNLLKNHEAAIEQLKSIKDPRIRAGCVYFYEQVYHVEHPPACDFDLEFYVKLVIRALSRSRELVALLEGKIQPTPTDQPDAAGW